MSDLPEGIGREVLYEVRDNHIAIIALNRPEKRNAVNGALAEALGHLVAQTESDPDIRVVVLTSSTDDIFCAGADLGEIARGNGRQLWRRQGGFAGITDAERTKPWIAAITGPALAGGCEISLGCDMIVASAGACFGLPEVKRGLFAAAGGAHRLARALPYNVALELIATGEPLGAERAYTLGFVNHLVPVEQVLATALALAATIAGNAPVSVVESLKFARVAAEYDEAELRTLSAEVTRTVMRTEDAKEGPLAFVEKRAPIWKGR
jgi:enoyl-CoA hydratase/carnithine racemase